MFKKCITRLICTCYMMSLITEEFLHYPSNIYLSQVHVIIFLPTPFSMIASQLPQYILLIFATVSGLTFDYKWTWLGNLGWNDLWWDSSSNLDIGHYHNSMRLGKRGTDYGIPELSLVVVLILCLVYFSIHLWSLYFCVGIYLQAQKASMHVLRWADKN